jgi:hypothetical protein
MTLCSEDTEDRIESEDPIVHRSSRQTTLKETLWESSVNSNYKNAISFQHYLQSTHRFMSSIFILSLSLSSSTSSNETKAVGRNRILGMLITTSNSCSEGGIQ